MRLGDDYDEVIEKGKSISTATVVCFATIIIIVVLVLLYNSNSLKRMFSNNTGSTVQIEEIREEEESSFSYESTGLKVSDLDFFNMYKDENEIEEPSTDESESSNEEIKEETDFENDGKHTLVVDYDGSSEWMAISQYLTKHNYDFTNLVNQAGKMKYFEEGKCTSFFGVDISKEQDYIDFTKLKKAGVNFVMIRVGARGYSSGNITIDEYFQDNLKRATDAGLNVGLYFMSQAITEDEAKEEANTVIASIGEYTISYPIAFVMSFPQNDTSRIEPLSRNDRSMIARAFLNTISEYGYKTMLYGDKTWLIKYVDLSKLISDYDIWLTQTDKDIPDYPYKFNMWQYNKSGNIDGISGLVNFNISFIDYSLK